MKTHYWVVRTRRADPNNGARYVGGRNVSGWADGVSLRHAFRWGSRYNAMRAAIAMGGAVVRVRRRAVPKCFHRNVSALIERADVVLDAWGALARYDLAGDGEKGAAIGVLFARLHPRRDAEIRANARRRVGMTYAPPFRTRPNNRYPNALVTIEDSNGFPMLTTHDEKLAVRVAELLTADMVGGLVFPGWTCPGCRAFNGAAKEILKECRGCGAARPA